MWNELNFHWFDGRIFIRACFVWKDELPPEFKAESEFYLNVNGWYFHLWDKLKVWILLENPGFLLWSVQLGNKLHTGTLRLVPLLRSGCLSMLSCIFVWKGGHRKTTTSPSITFVSVSCVGTLQKHGRRWGVNDFLMIPWEKQTKKKNDSLIFWSVPLKIWCKS